MEIHKSIYNNETPLIYGGGERRRDFIYVDDNARGTSLAMDKWIPGESYNIGSGTSTTFNEIYIMLKEEMGSPVKAQHIPNPLKSYQYFTLADISKAKKDLGFIPGYDLRKDIRKMLDYDIKSI